MSRCYTEHCDTTMKLRARIPALEGEIRMLSLVRESDARERRKYKEEVLRLKRKEQNCG